MFHVPQDLELDPMNQFLFKLCTLPLYNEDAAVQHEPQEASTAIIHTPRRKIGLKKKLTPRKDVSATLARGTSTKALGDPSSPAANTKSKKQLLLE